MMRVDVQHAGGYLFRAGWYNGNCGEIIDDCAFERKKSNPRTLDARTQPQRAQFDSGTVYSAGGCTDFGA
jgi:hypothetical protein